MRRSAIYPELVTGRNDQFVMSTWSVDIGSATRGRASCDFLNRRIEVPLGTSELDRVVRAHELVHLRVSPHDVAIRSTDPDISQRAAECAEEFRINQLLSRMGFNTDLLTDGSERTAGEKVAHGESWGEAVCFLIAILETGGEKPFLRGVRKVRPEWIRPLNAIRRRALAMAAATPTSLLGSTDRLEDDVEHLPMGCAKFTLPLARLISSASHSLVPTSVDELGKFRRSLEPGGRRAPSGVFASLIFAEDVPSLPSLAPRVNVRPRAETSGTALRYPSRLLTDPQQRAFIRNRRSPSGIVVIDQSGSMDIPETDLTRLLSEIPGACVLGYSHRPGSVDGTANAWIIAENGFRVAKVPSGNVGNGVDGPVLRWALTRRRNNEPIVWVTDGQVTDSHDHPSLALSQQCASMVLRHRIRLVRTIGEATLELRQSRPTRSDLASFGRVGRILSSSE